MSTRPTGLRVHGSITPPGDKSISHRVLILAALVPGTSRISGLADGEDVRSTMRVLRALGVDISGNAGAVEITSHGVRALHDAGAPLGCGNSGTTARLLAGVAAALPFGSTFTGDASLMRRPMGRIVEPLRAMGAVVELREGETLPMTVHGGGLRPLTWHTSQASAQVKSAILLAGLAGAVDVSVAEPVRSRDHTERLLRHLGADITIIDNAVHLRVGRRLPSLELRVPGDASAAAFLAALALLADHGSVRIEDVLLNDTRTGWIDVLRRMGGRIVATAHGESAGEPVGAIEVEASALIATEVAATEVPGLIDELPLIGCIAARASGETVVRGAVELRVKESDRIRALVENLRAVGADADELADGFIVRGSARALSGRVRSRGDHRITMAFGVLAALPGNDISIDDRRCVAVSFPGYWRALELLGARFAGAPG